MLAPSLGEREERAASLCGMRVGMCPEVRLEGWVKCFAPSLGGVAFRGHALYPAFALGFAEGAVGFLVS